MRGLFALVLCLFMLAGCDNAPQPLTGLPDGQMAFTTSTGQTIRLWVEVAADGKSRETGMMHRDAIPSGTGMLFVFPDEDMRYFWMKDTLVPLDLIFINAAGNIVHIHPHAVPFDETTIPSVYPSQYVLEVGAGQALRLGLKIGDQVSQLPLANQK